MPPLCQAMISKGNDSISLPVQVIHEGYSPFFVDNNKSRPLPNELTTSTCISSSLSTRFPLHKGFPSLLYNPSTTFPYRCRFISIRYQVAALYHSSLDLSLLCFRVIIIKLDELPIFFKEIFPFSSSSDLCQWTPLFIAPLDHDSLT
jgi:hypothetical protein